MELEMQRMDDEKKRLAASRTCEEEQRQLVSQSRGNYPYTVLDNTQGNTLIQF